MKRFRISSALKLSSSYSGGIENACLFIISRCDQANAGANCTRYLGCCLWRGMHSISRVGISKETRVLLKPTEYFFLSSWALPTYAFVVVIGKEDGKWWRLSSAPSLTCIGARAEQRHTRGRHDNARCRLIGLEAVSTVVFSRTSSIQQSTVQHARHHTLVRISTLAISTMGRAQMPSNA